MQLSSFETSGIDASIDSTEIPFEPGGRRFVTRARTIQGPAWLYEFQADATIRDRRVTAELIARIGGRESVLLSFEFPERWGCHWVASAGGELDIPAGETLDLRLSPAEIRSCMIFERPDASGEYLSLPRASGETVDRYDGEFDDDEEAECFLH